MANMAYCRFENTYKDLLDCDDHMDDDDLSETEKKYRDKLIERCRRIAADYDED